MTITEADLDDMLTLPQAATLLGVSRSTVERMIARHELPHTRIGSGRGRIRIQRRALFEHINDHTVTGELSDIRERRLIGIRAAAQTYGVSETTLRRWIHDGELTGYRVGSKIIRVDPAEVLHRTRRPERSRR